LALLVTAEPPAVCRLSLHRDQPHKNLIKTTNCAQKKKIAEVFVIIFLVSSYMGIVVLQKSSLF